ncbi:MAG: MFS transporter, partial [Phycisphaerales bacterium]|nr:MFS transporter [Phycisphaerales bacterium]
MTLARLNPFRGLPNPREVWAWGMYDLANQSFTLLINTMFFGLYVQEVVAPDKPTGDRLWGTIGPLSLLVVVLIGPFLGATADARGWKKRMLIGSGVLCVGFTCAFGLIQPGWMLVAALLYIPANIFYNIGENFLASFLPLVSTKKNIGRVSATGWAMGYVGALLLLLISGVLITIFGWTATEQYRPLFVLAGIWFAVVAIPTVLFLHEDRPERTARGALGEGLHRMRQTILDASRYAQLLRFLSVFFIYSMGTQVV